jgi:hypothetical protein
VARQDDVDQKRSKKVSTNDEIAQVGSISANGDTELRKVCKSQPQ